jgi:hypothetical protein
LERFKVKAGSKESVVEYEYFGIIKVKIPRGVIVSAPMIKAEIEVRIEDVIRLLAHAYRIYRPDFDHDLLPSRSIEEKDVEKVFKYPPIPSKILKPDTD